MVSAARRIASRCKARLYPLLYRPDAQRDDLVRLGTEYGGWWVPLGLLRQDSVCYCVGVGTDISFDLALINACNCEVWGVDPTPRSADYVAALPANSKFHLVPVGLAGHPGTVAFWEPANPTHVSHSIKNIQGTSNGFKAEVVTVSGLMDMLHHARVDLLKLDIEGAEHDVIANMIDAGIFPTIICVEYDQPEPLSWGRQTTRLLRGAGYELAKLDGLNLTFVYSDPA